MKKKDPPKILKIILPKVVYFLIFAFLLSLIPFPNIYFQKVQRTQGVFLPEEFKMSDPPLIPYKTTDTPVPDISAQGIYILDIPSNVVIYGKNPDMKFLPASTTKIATALVILDRYQLDDVMTVNNVVNNGKTMGLVPKEQLTVESLLYGMLVHSGNDAAYALAQNYPGGLEAFVVKMNDKAKTLHLAKTHFTNPAGFDDENNYTTPSDLAQLAKDALTNKIFSKIISTKSITVSDVNFTYFHALNNVNELLGKIPGVGGVKTGFTDMAGEILVSEVKKNGNSVLFVVLKSNDRFGETTKLIDWVFSNFAWKNVREIIKN